LGEPTHRIDGFAGLPAAVVAGFEVVGAEVVVDAVGVEGVEGVVGTVGVEGVLGVVLTIDGGGGTAMVDVEVEAVVVVVVARDALPTGGMTNTCPTQIRLGLEILLARWITGYLRALP
jgi:hypothetical protein